MTLLDDSWRNRELEIFGVRVQYTYTVLRTPGRSGRSHCALRA